MATKRIFDKQHREWSKQVLERDNRTCRICGKRVRKGSRQIHAHHIISFATNEELRYYLDNGVALCKNCHRSVHSKRFNNLQKNSPCGDYPLDFNI